MNYIIKIKIINQSKKKLNQIKMPPKRCGKRATFMLDSKIIAQLIFTVN